MYSNYLHLNYETKNQYLLRNQYLTLIVPFCAQSTFCKKKKKNLLIKIAEQNYF